MRTKFTKLCEFKIVVLLIYYFIEYKNMKGFGIYERFKYTYSL